VKRLVLALLLLTLPLLTACGGLIRAGQTPIPGPTGTGTPSPTGTAVPGPGEGFDGAPGDGQGEVGDEGQAEGEEGQAEEPVTEGPALTG
jgi:hypothetical protein